MRRWHGSISIAVVVASACSEPPPLESRAGSIDRIIDGERCERSTYPSALALVERTLPSDPYRVSCSGVLIAPDAVATAAHCLDGELTTERWVSRDPDLDAVREDQLEARIISTVLHPDFDPEAFASAAPGLSRFDDIGIALLDGPLSEENPILVADTESLGLQDSATVDIVGWGASSAQDFSIGVGRKRCATTTIQELGTFEMQVGSQGARKCIGDSGGPTYLEAPGGRRVVGLASHAYDAEDCAQGAVDTRIDVYHGWIDAQLRAACEDGTRQDCDPPGLLVADPIDESQGGCAATGPEAPSTALSLTLLALALGRRAQRRRAHLHHRTFGLDSGSGSA